MCVHWHACEWRYNLESKDFVLYRFLISCKLGFLVLPFSKFGFWIGCNRQPVTLVGKPCMEKVAKSVSNLKKYKDRKVANSVEWWISGWYLRWDHM